MPIIRVLPDVPAVDRPFDYESDVAIYVGTIVRVPFGGRRVRGWVLDGDVTNPEKRELRQIVKVVGHGPDPEMIELCRWASWRWSGRLVTLLRLASPDTVVRSVPGLRGSRHRKSGRSGDGGANSTVGELSSSILRSEPGTIVFRTSPITDATEIAIAAAELGQAIIITPSAPEADRITRHLRSAGYPVARWPRDWAQAAAGAVVVGTRGAVFAPASQLSALVVLDEHDERLQSESSPTWNAREVAVERARRAGIPCLLVSPCPSLDAYRAQAGQDLLDPSVGPSVTTPGIAVSTSLNRAGWAPVLVIDRRGEDVRRSGLFSSELVQLMRGAVAEARMVTCILNRTGRARLLACRSCSTLATCHECGSAVHLSDLGDLVCGRCGASRPLICAECGSVALAQLKLGVSRAREELEALLRVPVAAVTAGTGSAGDAGLSSLVTIGTVAALSRRTPGGLVAFVDFDQELLAPRYRAAEDALALLVAANRVVGGRSPGGTIVIQTRMAEHEVIVSALRADPSILTTIELRRRSLLGLPPVAAMARIGGEGAPEFVDRLGEPEGVVVTSAGDGNWLVKSRSPGRLQDALAGVRRPSGRLRLQVDPHRLER